MDPRRDPDALRTGQYRDDRHLAARMELHRRFGSEGTPWHRWVFERLPLRPGARVVEIGCGPATLWVHNAERMPAGVALTLSDLSEGMLARAREALRGWPTPVGFQRVDASALPFAESSTDLVVANHMLYHVPDLARTLAEVRRVLAPGGALAAATNGAGHMAELWALARAAVEEIDGPGAAAAAVPPRLAFDLENGADALRAVFDEVRLERRSEPLRVTDAEALVAYVASYRPLSEGVAGALRRRAATVIEERGAVRVSRESGLFLAR